MKKADIYYVMCGIGPEKEELEQYVKEHHLEKNIQFAGFRSDVHEILQCADCFVLSSFREGVIRGIDGSNDRRAPCCVQQNQRKC